jgi:plasmid stabilization system protein ParE
MNEGYGLHPDAYLDLDEIRDYIAQDSPDAADRVIDEIFACFERLARFPGQGHVRQDLTSKGLRFVVVREYLIAYAPERKPLWIIAVLHGRRNPRLIAALLRDRS